MVSKEFQREVDYLHGVDHILSRDDASFIEIVKAPSWDTQTLGTGYQKLNRSYENLASRIARLRGASDGRKEELQALINLVEFNKGILNEKLGTIIQSTTNRFESQCVSKMSVAEAFLAKVLTRDLGFLAIKPPFGIQKKNKNLDRILAAMTPRQYVSNGTQTTDDASEGRLKAETKIVDNALESPSCSPIKSDRSSSISILENENPLRTNSPSAGIEEPKEDLPTELKEIGITDNSYTKNPSSASNMEIGPITNLVSEKGELEIKARNENEPSPSEMKVDLISAPDKTPLTSPSFQLQYSSQSENHSVHPASKGEYADATEGKVELQEAPENFVDAEEQGNNSESDQFEELSIKNSNHEINGEKAKMVEFLEQSDDITHSDNAVFEDREPQANIREPLQNTSEQENLSHDLNLSNIGFSRRLPEEELAPDGSIEQIHPESEKSLALANGAGHEILISNRRKIQAESISIKGDIATANRMAKKDNIWSSHDMGDSSFHSIYEPVDTPVTELHLEKGEDVWNFPDSNDNGASVNNVKARDSLYCEIPANAQIFTNRESFHSSSMTPRAGNPVDKF